MNLSLALSELDRLFEVFNKHFFQNFLEKPIIIIQSTGKKPINGYCTLEKTWSNTNEDYYEIGVSAEHLNRDVYGLCGTLIHEMVHLYNLKVGIKDVAPNFVYHNKKFKLEAEKHGLIISQAPKIGWSLTTLTDETKEFVNSLNIDSTLFSVSRKTYEKVKTVSPTKHYTYTCPVCNEKIVSSNPDLEVVCSHCNTMFERKIK